MKKYLFILFAIILSNVLFAQNGYIYVHKKATSEIGSPNFSFELKQGATTVKSFTLNDQPDALNAFDLGNSHGSGEGQLWAVVNNSSVSGSTHNITGTLYTRAVNSTSWVATTITNARSVDGIGNNTAVYSTEDGSVYTYNAGSTTRIWNPGLHAGVKVIDVASGGPGGIIVIVTENGRIFKYAGTGTTDVWGLFSNPAIVDVKRVDVNPTNQQIVYYRGNNNDSNIYTVGGGSVTNTPATIAGPSGTTIVPTDLRDIAISNDGTIYSSYYNSSSSNNVYEYKSGSWTDNPRARGLTGLTGGIGNQVWGINKVNHDIIKHSIFARMSNGNWLDDERIRTTVANGNSIMIPVPAGSYLLQESAVTNWNNSNILIYDPTSNSTTDVTNSAATINVAAGEVVHVVYANALKNSVVSPGQCATNNILTFGFGAATYGPPVSGFTSYHYLDQGFVSDGYYSLAKNNTDWSGNTTLLNHTASEPNGYFGIFNASYSTDDFFRQTVTGLVIGTTYEFAFWVADLSPQTDIRPNITMGIEDSSTGVLLNSIDTGAITSTIWKQYKFNFTATSTIGEIFLKNNSIGGSGNDLAIDDITFAPAPIVLPAISPAAAYLCSSKSVPDTYTFTNGQLAGVWSTDQPTLLTIDPVTGVASTIYGAEGTANIIYTYTSSSGCVSVVKNLVTVGNCVCNDPVTNTFAGSESKHGITLLKRAGESPASADNWPMVRNSAFTVLESNTKGFVITRMTTLQINTIASPQDGMMVYDTTANCLKLYSTDSATPSNSKWSCFNVQTCP